MVVVNVFVSPPSVTLECFQHYRVKASLVSSCPRVLISPPARVSTPKLQVISGQIVTEEIHYTEGSETKTVSLLPSLSITREIHYNTSRAKVKMALIVAMRF